MAIITVSWKIAATGKTDSSGTHSRRNGINHPPITKIFAETVHIKSLGGGGTGGTGGQRELMNP